MILIAGGNIGLGRESALPLSKHKPSEIWLAARDSRKADTTIADIRRGRPNVSAHFMELDLGSFDSIKNAARTFLAHASCLDILILNAGIMDVLYGLTKEGYEMHFGVNHVRVIFLSSMAHRYTVSNGIDFDIVKTQGDKLANVVYARELAKRFPQFKTVSVHPGVVKTDLHNSLGKTVLLRLFQAFTVQFIGLAPREGAKNQLWAANSKEVLSGEKQFSKSEELGKKLWNWMEKELQVHNP
ncbi:hypothetical protein EDB81DRAFT_868422 [Dactylonectria macrodidyma]|uniref:Uncharacterized protein n=1 Tax=Dactylonectria macrodidyma TaxID=307937 RepID=A0A9P9F5I5_9HYPO|nr:hypothetical protein EDB81DRAFT_868422 [Dactylonectria macrodidyma]